ncbi:MAG TPA: GNAT family N-acetyltransferase [Acidimicrobiales bacterium]|nr:GNAT family N-acetyltransferase [Acidimicrobiales bacterium]
MANVTTETLTSADADTFTALARLLPQVSSRAGALTRERVATILASSSTKVVIARLDGSVMGMALLLVCTTLTGQFGLVEEVAVDEVARGRHVGVALMVHLLQLASGSGLDFVELTSRPSRVAANGLYRSLGFRLRETNCYRHDLSELPELR